MRGRHRGRMPGTQRLAIYLIMGALWLSGCLWLYLDQFMAKRGEFGATPHPLEPAILLIHGVIAILSMYLFGWVSARHILRWWPARLRRLSGGTLGTFFLLLAVSGFALFFVSDDDWQHIAVRIHDVLGLGVAIFAAQHWFLVRRRDRVGL
jgi:hypothetical protein